MILTGKEVADAVIEEIRQADIGVTPRLAIVRVGEKPSDLSYERGLLKKAEAAGIEVDVEVLPEEVSTDDVVLTMKRLNLDRNIHGIMAFRPMPSHIDDEAVRNSISPEKDVDGATDMSMAGIYSGTELGFPPCTALACMEILHHYNIPVAGKKAVVIGRSVVIGKPVAMLLLKENATVTVCHSRTENLAEVCKDADIVIACIGKAKAIGKDIIGRNATVIDVGINFVDGKMCGDVDGENVECANLTPVPGGVGAVTSAVLMKNVMKAAVRAGV